MDGWIKLHRKILGWQWINNPEMVSLFVYLLLRANHSNTFWQQTEILRGQLITSPEKLSNTLGISYQTIRTNLKKLEKSNEISKKSTNKFTIITICNYEQYQSKDEETNKQLTNNQQTTNKQLTNNQQTTNKQLTTDKNEKNNKELKEELRMNKKFLLSEISISDACKIEMKEEYLKAAKGFQELFRKNCKELHLEIKSFEKADAFKWSDGIRKMIELDNFTMNNLRELYDFLNNEIPSEKFSWKRNILSISNLREHASQILIKARSKKIDKPLSDFEKQLTA